MYFFKFKIGKNSDGSRISYSPGWFGEMNMCPRNVKVLLYNDKEGYGIAQADDKFIPPEVKVIDEAEATKILSNIKSEPGVFIGIHIAARWLSREIMGNPDWPSDEAVV